MAKSTPFLRHPVIGTQDALTTVAKQTITSIHAIREAGSPTCSGVFSQPLLSPAASATCRVGIRISVFKQSIDFSSTGPRRLLIVDAELLS
jgi:hypothetical protein